MLDSHEQLSRCPGTPPGPRAVACPGPAQLVVAAKAAVRRSAPLGAFYDMLSKAGPIEESYGDVQRYPSPVYKPQLMTSSRSPSVACKSVSGVALRSAACLNAEVSRKTPTKLVWRRAETSMRGSRRNRRFSCVCQVI